LLLFKVNYGKELKIGFEIIKKRRNIKAEEFLKKIKKIYKEIKKSIKEVIKGDEKIYR